MSDTSDPRQGEAFCLYDPAKLADPFPDYDYLRRERPVLHHREMGAWFVFRHADVDRCFHDRRLSNRRGSGYAASVPSAWRTRIASLFDGPFARWVLSLDGEAHLRLRHRLHAGLTEQAVTAAAPMIEATVAELLDAVQGRGAMDAAADFAYPLPVLVISTLLGVRREDRALALQWSDDLATFFNAPPPTDDTTRNLIASAEAMMGYLGERLAERRAAPRDDFLSAMLRPPDPSGHPALGAALLSDEDIVANAVVLLVAGHETTRNLIGSALWLLLTHPDQLAAVRADPHLMHGAIEEALRLEPPNPIMSRLTTEAVEIAGERIPAGELVYLCIGSANRDPEHFPDPDRFDISRDHSRHFGFGSGPHYCMGAILARKEAHVALTAVLARHPDLRLDEAHPPEWTHQAGLRGPRSLAVRWGPR